MSPTPDIGRVSLEGLSRRELEILAHNARQGGRDTTARVVDAELRRRREAPPGAPSPARQPGDGKLRPELSVATAHGRRPRRWALGFAAAAALGTMIGGAFVLKDILPARPAPVTQVAVSSAPAPRAPSRTINPAETDPSAPHVTSAAVAGPLGLPTDPDPSSPRVARQLARAAPESRLSTLRSAEAIAEAPPSQAEILATSGPPKGALLGCGPASGGAARPACEAASQTPSAYPSTAPARIVVARNMPPLTPPMRGRSMTGPTR